jgi:hypothetical protein
VCELVYTHMGIFEACHCSPSRGNRRGEEGGMTLQQLMSHLTEEVEDKRGNLYRSLCWVVGVGDKRLGHDW